MKNLTENQVLDIFMLAYRLGEIKDMSNLLNSDMRVRALEHVNNYLQENKVTNKPRIRKEGVYLLPFILPETMDGENDRR